MSSDANDLATLLRHGFDPTPPAEVSFVVTVIEGAEAGQSVELFGTEPSPTLLGQSEVCGLRLGDAEVSRRHATLEVNPRGLVVRDLGSTNGTFVDGLSVVEAHLVGGETLRLGATALRVERRDGARGERLSAKTSFGRLIGASTEMRRLYPLLERIAASEVPAILEGETGTGKEILAESIHEQGPRASGPFVVFDCTAVAPNLVESELFGHERGAFTGASATRAGLFELANGGTIFIDEIGELEPSLQPKLLRVLERMEIRRVGGNRSIRIDARVLAATHRDLDAEVQARRFREDLFHRLCVCRVELPPLRARRGDVAVLARHFWRAFGGADEPPRDVVRAWERDLWPGNVRELRNAVSRRIALGDLTPAALAPVGEASGDPVERVLAMGIPLAQARQLLVDEFERRYVRRAFDEHGGNIGKAAAAAGVARRYFQLLRARAREG